MIFIQRKKIFKLFVDYFTVCNVFVSYIVKKSILLKFLNAIYTAEKIL